MRVQTTSALTADHYATESAIRGTRTDQRLHPSRQASPVGRIARINGAAGDALPTPATPGATERPGLRERKKRFTHDSIASAAFDLTIERGLEATTLDIIAERAFVSPRTISNYFRSKEAAIVAAGAADFTALFNALNNPDSDVTLLAVFREGMSAAARGWSDERLALLRATEELVASHASLLPHRMAQYNALEQEFCERVAHRTGADANTESFPRLISGVAVVAFKTASGVWTQREGGSDELADLIERAFDGLESGLVEVR